MSYPEWFVESWIGEFGPETAGACSKRATRRRLSLRANTLRVSRDELAEKLGGAMHLDAAESSGSAIVNPVVSGRGVDAGATIRVATQPGLYAPEALRIVGPLESVESLPGFAEGLFSVQDESSMLVAHVMGRPRLVIDACAAPGGKATHIAELSRDEARVVACDVSARKVALISESARRLGLRSVEAVECDARELPAEWAGKADAALVDAPCTGLGVLARRADARWRKEPDDECSWRGAVRSERASACVARRRACHTTYMGGRRMP